MDIEDNADALRMRQSLDLTITRLVDVLRVLVQAINSWAELPLIAFTHLQPAEPTTLVINDNQVEFAPAAHLWGKEIPEESGPGYCGGAGQDRWPWYQGTGRTLGRDQGTLFRGWSASAGAAAALHPGLYQYL